MPELPRNDSTTTIGSDCTFKGEMSFEGSMRFEGRFEGKLQTKGTLTIGKQAHISAEMAVGKATVEGQFKGNIVAAEKIELAASANVSGDIRAPKLVVAEGATFVGNVHISPDALKGVDKSEFVVPMPATPIKR